MARKTIVICDLTGKEIDGNVYTFNLYTGRDTTDGASGRVERLYKVPELSPDGMSKLVRLLLAEASDETTKKICEKFFGDLPDR